MIDPAYHIAGSMDELAPWRDQWDALADARGLPMARYAWFGAAERHLADAGQVRVIYGLDRSGDLVAAVALECREDTKSGRDYQILGLSRLYEPSALLYRDDAARVTLLRTMLELRSPVILGRLWPGDAGPSGDRRYRLDRHAVWFSKCAAPSQYLEFTQGYEDYIAQLPSQRRYDLRRAYKRAGAMGTLSADFMRPSPAELDALLDVALDIEVRSWKGETGSAVKTHPDLHGFFRDMLASNASDGSVLIAFLKVGATIVAMQICLQSHARLWLLKIGYDRAYRTLSPGLILMNEVIKYSYNHRLHGLEFLGSAEDWVDAWRPSLRDYRLIAAFPHNAGSLLRLGRDAADRLMHALRGATTAHG